MREFEVNAQMWWKEIPDSDRGKRTEWLSGVYTESKQETSIAINAEWQGMVSLGLQLLNLEMPVEGNGRRPNSDL